MADLVSGNYNGNSVITFGERNGAGLLKFEKSAPLFSIPTASAVGCGDFDGDGLPDLIVGVEDPNGYSEYHLLLQRPTLPSASLTRATTSAR